MFSKIFQPAKNPVSSSFVGRNLFLFLFIIMMSNTLFAQTATKPTGSGTTSEDPYLITSLENLYWLSVNYSGEIYCKQTADINASSTLGWANGGWIPIGPGQPFTGNYNGNGYTISGLYTNRPAADFQGLFGYISGAEISDLGVINVNINGRNNVGGLVGQSGTSIINRCFSTGSINNNSGSYIGGLVGYNASSTISNCYSFVNMTGAGEYLGGFVGRNDGTSLNCFSTGNINVTGHNTRIGGFSGLNGGTITESFWDMGTSNQTTSLGGNGLSTADMKTASTFIDAGWDESIWGIEAGFNNGYPYLKWQNPGGGPLPVELSSFTANMLNNQVHLNWQTATEVNNYGFKIERQVSNMQLAVGNQSQWKDIGFVKGNGNSNSSKSYEFVDDKLLPGKYLYRLKQIDTDGKFEYSKEIEIEVGAAPMEFNLAQNYPNPFNPETIIGFTLPENGTASLKVYNTIGEVVATLFNDFAEAGKFYNVRFDASSLAAGIYFAKLQYSGKQLMKKMLYLK